MLILTPTPIGNLKDISYNALEVLKRAEIVFCEDSRITKKLFKLLNISLNKKFISMHSHNEKEVLKKLNPQILISKECIYVSDAGMPAISDPGSKLVKFAQKHNIPYTVIPGANAALTAYVASGFEGEFCFFMFLPHKGKQRAKKLEEIINSPKISIFYEAPHRIEKLIDELKILIPEREIFLAKELTKIHETYIKAKVKDVTISNPKGEWVIVINKATKTNKLTLTYEDIKKLNLPLKEKAKLLSKISEKSAKEIYKELIKD